jgi:NADH-quinone oxidoreductase subunit C
MSAYYDALAEKVGARFGATLARVPSTVGELSFSVAATDLIQVATALRDETPFSFEQLVDLTALDLAAWGQGDWTAESATRTGFSRGRAPPPVGGPESVMRPAHHRASRFGLVCHLLSVTHNHRLRLHVACPDEDPPLLPSLVEVWPSANWMEREVFDMFGVLFDGHPDLRRILTDYGFIGHPFRKDFPLSGHVEVRYDPAAGRVVYQPVTIEPRNNVPRVIRKDPRFAG